MFYPLSVFSDSRPLVLKLALFPAVIAFVATLAAGRCFLHTLKTRFPERIDSDSRLLNELHARKQNTPSMGGLFLLVGFLIAVFCVRPFPCPFRLTATLAAIALGMLGFADDLIKIRSSRKGLTVRQKLLWQWVIAIVCAVMLYRFRNQISAGPVSLLYWLSDGMSWIFIPWAALVIVSCSNAVNLTDGLDGLAAGTLVISSLAVSLCPVIVGRLMDRDDLVITGGHESLVLACALAGASLGFLWYNRHPARVFMGDTGALSSGGILAIAALTSGMELLLPLAGIVFVIETLSVIIQVRWYQRTGRRLLLCSPLHNHYVFRKIPEDRIVAAFRGIAVVGASAAVAVAAAIS